MPPVFPSPDKDTPENDGESSITDDFSIHMMAALQPSSSETDEEDELVGWPFSQQLLNFS